MRRNESYFKFGSKVKPKVWVLTSPQAKKHHEPASCLVIDRNSVLVCGCSFGFWNSKPKTSLVTEDTNLPTIQQTRKIFLLHLTNLAKMMQRSYQSWYVLDLRKICLILEVLEGFAASYKKFISEYLAQFKRKSSQCSEVTERSFLCLTYIGRTLIIKTNL